MKPFDKLPQNAKFHAPLQPGDTGTVTHGCRHTSPDICRKNTMPGVCAFVRTDGTCHAPPASWARQYKLLKTRGDSGANGHD